MEEIDTRLEGKRRGGNVVVEAHAVKGQVVPENVGRSCRILKGIQGEAHGLLDSIETETPTVTKISCSICLFSRYEFSCEDHESEVLGRKRIEQSEKVANRRFQVSCISLE